MLPNFCLLELGPKDRGCCASFGIPQLSATRMLPQRVKESFVNLALG